jgi:hypothetical protein
MKKALLLLFLFTTLLTTQAQAQMCERDSNILVTGGLLSPAPWSPDSPFYNLALACIDEPYNQSVTINVPATFTFMNITVPIVSVSIPTMNGIGNYPIGMQYTCDPPNCVFNASTLGCIRMHGTPSIENLAPDTLDLKLTATVNTSLGPVPVMFPGDPSAPDDHYYLILNPKGGCVLSASDLGSPFSALRAVPNPASAQTRIEVQSMQTGTFQFEVFDLLGKRVHTEKVRLFEGANQFMFDASALATGTYVYSLGNVNGKSVRRLVKN